MLLVATATAIGLLRRKTEPVKVLKRQSLGDTAGENAHWMRSCSVVRERSLGREPIKRGGHGQTQFRRFLHSDPEQVGFITMD